MKKRFFVHENVLSSSNGTTKLEKDFKWYESSVPCRSSCPADTDIPSYLEAIYKKDFNKAYQINLEDNVFPEILGRVCSRPCEDSCRHSKDNNGESVAICYAKRSSGDFKSKTFKVLPYAKNSKKKIAIIGSGVAGLTCARELKRFGHSIEIFEKHKSPGGMLNQGIPIFRLPRKVIDKEIKQITDMGIKIHCRHAVETQEDLNQLSKNFDAVVLAMGTLKPNKIDQDFSTCDDVEDGLDFLLRVNEYKSKVVGKNVVIIGGGYTAMDCSRVALRLGAKTVKTFYRRDVGDLVILPGELEELENEKGKMLFNARPLNLIVKNSHLAGLEFIKTQLNKKAKLIDIKNSKFSIKTDHIILAIGQRQNFNSINKIIKYKTKINKSVSNFKFEKNVFTAGDYALGATTLIDAIAHAKNSAKAVDEYLMKRIMHKSFITVKNVKTTNRNLEMNYIPMNKMPTLKFNARNNNNEVEIGYKKNQSMNESSRCYLCHYKFEINNNLCVLCDECLLVKPVKDCIVEVKNTITNIEGDIKYNPIAPNKTNGIYHGKLYIDHKKCIRCGECEKVCPTNAISIQKIERIINATA
tara:strand:- start:1312 stop:3057 length:1746 start_codon:yes stop_codon:yes gene_type:complete